MTSRYPPPTETLCDYLAGNWVISTSLGLLGSSTKEQEVLGCSAAMIQVSTSPLFLSWALPQEQQRFVESPPRSQEGGGTVTPPCLEMGKLRV